MELYKDRDGINRPGFGHFSNDENHEFDQYINSWINVEMGASHTAGKLLSTDNGILSLLPYQGSKPKEGRTVSTIVETGLPKKIIIHSVTSITPIKRKSIENWIKRSNQEVQMDRELKDFEHYRMVKGLEAMRAEEGSHGPLDYSVLETGHFIAGGLS